MNELSLYILDIVQNSLSASSKNVTINITDSKLENIIKLEVIDDGCGMNDDTLNKVSDPFYTTRTTRKVGLGIPLFKELCLMCEGSFHIESALNKGTKLEATLKKDNIDTPPMGDLASSIYIIAINKENIDIEFNYKTDTDEFYLNTKEIKEILGDVPLTDTSVVVWLSEFIKEGLNNVK